MNLILNSRLSQFMTNFQEDLWDWPPEDPLILTPKLIDVIRVLELVNMERFVPSSQGRVGRPAEDRSPIARAFVAKAVLDIPTTEALIDRLQSDLSWRRSCGFQRVFAVPGAWTFSRAFAEFAAFNWPETTHHLLIGRPLGDQMIGHLLHEATPMEAREKPGSKPQPEPNVKRRRGRPRQGEERLPQPETVLEKQPHQPRDAMRANMPQAGAVGSQKNRQGHPESWIGDQRPIRTADGDLPLAAILRSASTHDRPVALPLLNLCDQRVTAFYALADSGYCRGIIREESRQWGPVPRIDHHPRRGEKIEFLPHEAERYTARTGVERTNRDLKDHQGGRQVRVRGAVKVYAHLRYGILVIAAEQLLRLLNEPFDCCNGFLVISLGQKSKQSVRYAQNGSISCLF
jgi:Transposase DDE domain/Transposase domain (DUF772)